MLKVSKAFSSFSVNDIQKAREFYGKTLGLELTAGPEGTLVLPFSGDTKALMYPKPQSPAGNFHRLEFSRGKRGKSCGGTEPARRAI